ncbi:MAG TPA: hypothetical protein VG013_04535 [Gemmataceae bacterium]|nr:hypothetical protein [Gemmataceae bacterium]
MKRTKVDPAIDREMVKASLGPRMPRGYRTPDLIDYFKRSPPPTNRSDVYQLGRSSGRCSRASNCTGR